MIRLDLVLEKVLGSKDVCGTFVDNMPETLQVCIINEHVILNEFKRKTCAFEHYASNPVIKVKKIFQQVLNLLFFIAIFRLHGSYEALKYACSQDGLADLMGGIIETFNIRQDPTSCVRVLSRLLKTTSVTTSIVQQQTKVSIFITQTQGVANRTSKI